MNKPRRAAASAVIAVFVSAAPLASVAQVNGPPAESAKPPLQIQHQTGLKVLIQVNHADTLPNGVGKQILATKNLLDQYAALGMKSGKDYDIVMVFRAEGSQFLLTDEAYDRLVKSPHPPGNPNRKIIDALQQAGVKMYECGVAMRMRGYVPEDLAPYSRVVVSGIGALVDFEAAGYMPVTP